MRIYLSGGFDQRERMRGYRDRLWAAKHDIVSSWLDECPPPEGMDQRMFFKKLGLKDVAELFAADLVIVDFCAPSTSGGRDVEFGIALARHQRCQLWMVGVPPRRSPFHELADREYATWDDALAALGCEGPERTPPSDGDAGLLSPSLRRNSGTVSYRQRPAQSRPTDALGEREIDRSSRLHGPSHSGDGSV